MKSITRRLFMKINHMNLSIAVLLTSLAGVASAHAESDQLRTFDDTYYTDPMTPRPMAPRQEQQQSITQNNYVPERTLRDEVIGLTPALGAMSFTNRNNAYTTRAMAGALLDFNLVPTIDKTNRDLYLGLTTGGFFSHLGSDSGNFFGGHASVSSTDNSNFVFIPADIKLGVNMGESFRLSGHAGGNVIYRSVANAINLGADSNTSDSLWRIYPDAGADAEWQVSKSVAINLRPDLTFTSGTALFAATLGATILDL
jgi:hypothetical protein